MADLRSEDLGPQSFPPPDFPPPAFPPPAFPPRRAALKAGLATGLAGVLLPGLGACIPQGQPRPGKVTVAGGETGGFYLEFATLLAESLQRHGVAGNAEPLVTGGSLENMERLLNGEATFAIALADAAAQRATAQEAAASAGPTAAPRTGSTPTAAATATAAGGLVAVGKVYENYVHCIVRKDSEIRQFGDLAGKTAAIGEPGSGTSLTTHRIIAASGLGVSAANPSAADTITELNLGLNSGLAALREGSVDALFWSGGVPTAAITAANEEVGVSLLDLSALIPATRTRYGAFYDRVLIPENSYEGSSAVWTVGVANLLLCRNDLDERIVKGTVELLVNSAQELIPKSSLGVQFLSPEALINTAGVPLHPAAAAAYRTLHG